MKIDHIALFCKDMKQYAEIADYAKVKGGEASMQRVVEALKSVDEGKGIESHVDIESVMKYMALQTIVVNFDCMTGRNTQNYYLREVDGKISRYSILRRTKQTNFLHEPAG